MGRKFRPIYLIELRPVPSFESSMLNDRMEQRPSPKSRLLLPARIPILAMISARNGILN